ncbi:MAG TPA: amidohydrolase family protein [Gemmatimonadota bacterium]|nr:amidohydrolase family protein [Gemmatimonadota bacterium]
MPVSSGRSPAAEESRSHALAFTGVQVIPMIGQRVLPDRTVLVQDGRIVEVGTADSVMVPSGAEIIRGEGLYLVPGLIDFHVHVRSESELLSYLAHGVTTVVNMRGSPEHLELARAVADGTTLGPWIYTAGPLIDGVPPIWSGSATRIVTSPAEARAAVAEQARAGYDLVKVYNNLDPGSLAAAVEEARRRDLAVVGHVPRNPDRAAALQRALDAGVAMIAHGEEFFFTFLGGASDAALSGRPHPSGPEPERIRAAARLASEAGVAVTPNLSFIAMTARMLEDLGAVLTHPEAAYLDPEVREMWERQNPTRRDDLERFTRRETIKYAAVRALTKALHEEDVLLLLGTDASAPGLYPGESALLELEELVAAGLTPYEALATGTRNAGRFLTEHVSDARPVGTIEPGSVANLVLLEENPLEDITAMRERVGVAVRGRWFPLERLEELRNRERN